MPNEVLSSAHFLPLRPRQSPIHTFEGLMLRELETAFAGTPGGWIWLILEPIAGILVLTLVFSTLGSSPPLGESHVLFYATGYLPFVVFGQFVAKMTATHKGNSALLAFPPIDIVHVLIAKLCVYSLVYSVAFVLLLFSCFVLFDLPHHPDPAAIWLALILICLFSWAIGLLNGVLVSFIPVWHQFWGILNRPLFFVSGIFFLPEAMPENLLVYLDWNPIVHLISMFRNATYSSYEARMADTTYVLIVTVAALALSYLISRSKSES